MRLLTGTEAGRLRSIMGAVLSSFAAHIWAVLVFYVDVLKLWSLQERLEEGPLLSQELGSENTDFEANSLECSERHLDRYCDPCSGCSDPLSDHGVNTGAASGLEGTCTVWTPATKAWRRGSEPTEGGQESATETPAGQINYYDRSPENHEDLNMISKPRSRDWSSTERRPQKQTTDWPSEQSSLHLAFPETCFKNKGVCERSRVQTDSRGANADIGDEMQQVQPTDSCSTLPEAAVNAIEATQQQDTNTHSKGSLTRKSRRNVQAGLLSSAHAEGHTGLVTEGRETPAVEGLEPLCERGLKRTDEVFQSQQKPVTCLTLNQSMSDNERRSALYVVAESIQNSSITDSDMSKLSNMSFITSHYQQNDEPEHTPKLKLLSFCRSEALMSEKTEESFRHICPSAVKLEGLGSGSQVRDEDHVGPDGCVKGSRLGDSRFELKKEKCFQPGRLLKAGHLIVKAQREAKDGSCICPITPQEAQCSVESCSATEDSLTKKVSSDKTVHVCSTIKLKPLHPHKANPFISIEFKHEGDVIISSCDSNPINMIYSNITNNFLSLAEDGSLERSRWIEDQDFKLSVFAKRNSLRRRKCLKTVRGEGLSPPAFHVWSEFWLFEQETHKINQDCGALAKTIVLSHPGRRGLLLRLNETENLTPTVHTGAQQGSSWEEEGEPNTDNLLLEYVQVQDKDKHSLNLSSLFESPLGQMKDERPYLDTNIDSCVIKQFWKNNKHAANVEKQKMTFLIPEQDSGDLGTYPLFDRITIQTSSSSPRTLCNGDPIPKWDITQWRRSKNSEACRSNAQRKSPPAAQCPGLPLVQTSIHVKSELPLTSCLSLHPSQSRPHTPAQERLLGHPFALPSPNPDCCEPRSPCPVSTTARARSSALHGALLYVEEPANSPERPERLKPKPSEHPRLSLLDAAQRKTHSHSCMSLHGLRFIDELEAGSEDITQPLDSFGGGPEGELLLSEHSNRSELLGLDEEHLLFL